jgi:TonB family protein
LGVRGSGGSSASGFDANDLLLYLGAAVVAAVGLSWLILAKPWVDAASVGEPPRETAVTPRPSTFAAAQAPTATDRTIEESLRLAGLAQSAGMLIEPPRYSAWALYMEVLESDPANAAARDGVRRVADALVARAATALEQGRAEAAKVSIDAVLARLPEHAAAQDLATQIEAGAVRRSAESDWQPAVAASAEPVQANRQSAIAAAAPEVSPLHELHRSFDAALSAGQLLLPDGESAKHFLNLLLALDSNDPTVTEARGRMLAALLERADEATQAVDAAAAETWIDEAAELGLDGGRVAQARAALTERLIDVESETPVPAATLVRTAYTPPRYPSAAENLEIEGWVDLEFVVAVDGSTTDVRAVAGSHDELFRAEAIAAAENWRFEPRIFHDRPIPQRSYTRVRFVLE